MPRFRPLLNRRHLMFLRATLGRGPAAAEAYRAWRSSEKFEDMDDLAYRIMPLLAETAEAFGLQDEDSGRMRGVAKHIWLSNMVRMRDLVEAKQALERAGIPVLLIKGGALFAREPQFAAMRAAGDYDLLVRRIDARRSIDLLRQQGFRSLGLRIELFSEADFDGDTHAVPMSKSDATRAIDLHWRAVSTVRQESLADELFASAEPSELFGQKVMIPGLAEHLLLAAIRPEPWDQQECLLRLIEITQLLRHCKGQLDWPRFETLMQRYEGGWIAAPLLALARDEAGAPMPADLVDRLWRSAAPAPSLELSMCQIRPDKRSVWHRLLLAAIRSLRLHVDPFSWRSALVRPGVVYDVFTDCAALLPMGRTRTLMRIWQSHIKDDSIGHEPIRFRFGFSVPEEEGRWTDQEFAVLEVSSDMGGAMVARLALDVVPFLPPGASRLVVYLYAGKGRPVKVVLKPGQQMPVLLELDAAVVGTPGKVLLALCIPGRARPRELGISIDHRLLGLFVRAVRLNGKSIFTPAGATA